MEWFLLYIIPCIIVFLICLIPSVTWWWFFGSVPIWALLVFMLGRYCIYADAYKAWEKNNYKGDHFWFEWTRCKENYAWAMDRYDPSHYVKIDFETFKKYFAVNPKRYELRPGNIIFDDENQATQIRMVVPRYQLWQYYKFRRAYLQSREMMNIIPFVQKDIDSTMETAQSYIEKAKRDFKSQFEQKGDST